jgi:hypothetical protein
MPTIHTSGSRLPLVALLLLPTLAAGCSAPSLRLTPRVGSVGLDGDFASDTTAAPGANAIGALGLDDSQVEFLPRADIEFGPLVWTLDYGALAYSGSGTAQANITIGDVEVEADGTLDSDIDLQLLRSSFTVDVLPTDTFDLGLGLGLGAAEVSAAITDTTPGSPTLGQTAATEEVVPLPFLSLLAGVEVGPFGAEAWIAFLSLSVQDVDVDYLDLDLSAYWRFADWPGADLRLVLGYRRIDVAAEYDDGVDRVEADLQFDGPYLGISVVL